MIDFMYKDICIRHPDEMNNKEAIYYVDNQFENQQHEFKNLLSIDIFLKDDEVELVAHKKSNITRIRRITGYCSNVNNFNSAKRSELADRKTHM